MRTSLAVLGVLLWFSFAASADKAVVTTGTFEYTHASVDAVTHQRYSLDGGDAQNDPNPAREWSFTILVDTQGRDLTKQNVVVALAGFDIHNESGTANINVQVQLTEIKKLEESPGVWKHYACCVAKHSGGLRVKRLNVSLIAVIP